MLPSDVNYRPKPMRRIFATLGERWAGRGWLGQTEDVFFLTLSEVETIARAGDPLAAGKDLTALVAARRLAWRYWFTVTHPEVIGPDARPVTAPASGETSGTALEGIAASGGRARGTARIIADPREGHRLQPGDTLAARSTDPGWTPLFPLVGGLVLEVAGQLSHGATVAREYGLPAVVNVLDATRRIRDGQTVQVDSTAGRVSLVDSY
ncbi:MAG: hypothetical protein HY331_08695 [Chloroflexi bacterium]|nr:hypothetical protein [Chloroflexota bacterium]